MADSETVPASSAASTLDQGSSRNFARANNISNSEYNRIAGQIHRDNTFANTTTLTPQGGGSSSTPFDFGNKIGKGMNTFSNIEGQPGYKNWLKTIGKPATATSVIPPAAPVSTSALPPPTATPMVGTPLENALLTSNPLLQSWGLGR